MTRSRMADALTASSARRSATAVLGLACLFVLVVSSVSAARNSLVVDGTRYFWLDDDQMISMRYARNLAEGCGPVWNRGERVEGYTNPLWVLVMAVVHLLPIADAHTSLWIRGINAALACLVLLLAWRLMQRLMGEPGIAGAAGLLVLAVSHELLFWSMHGFETTLLTALFLWSIGRLLDEVERGSFRVLTFVAVGLLPVVRSDGYHLWVGAALLAVGLAKERARVLGWLALAAAPPIAQLAFRLAYYGEWVPNTYFLRVAGHSLPDRLRQGAIYEAYFFLFYWLIVMLAVLGFLATRDRRRGWMLASSAISLAYVIWVGGDNFFGARFLAPHAPVLIALASAGIREIAAGRRVVERTLSLAQAGSYLAFAGFLALFGSSYTLLSDPNGGPGPSLIAALAIAKSTHPQARVAVHAAGVVPYFSRRYSIDWLGKTDAAVAKLPPRGAAMAHDKLDPQHSLNAQRADFAVMLWLPQGVGSCTSEARRLVEQVAPSWVREMYGSPAFQAEFCGGAIEMPGAPPIYARRGAGRVALASRWEVPRVGGS